MKHDAERLKIEKNNARVMYEWDEFEKKYPGPFDALPDEVKQIATDLAEMQGKREVKLFGRFTVPRFK